jgi:signal transduction histidine kinase
MNIYSVYTDSSKKEKEPILIKQGFSFIVGVFNLFWALYHKMWGIFFALLIISFILGTSSSSAISYNINFAILFIFGFFASEIREYYAVKSGLKLSDVILASSEEEAEIKYYTRSKTLNTI